MPVAVNRDETIGCSNPRIVFVNQEDGLLADLDELKFSIFDVSQGGAPSEVVSETTVDLDDCPSGQRVGTGRYAISWTVPADENVGAHEVRWKWTRDGGDEQEGRQRFEVLDDELLADQWRGLITTKRLRDELVLKGSPPSESDLKRAQVLIDRVTREIEDRTARTFEPEFQTHFFSVGEDAAFVVHVEPPIVGIQDVELRQRGDDDFNDVDNDDLMIFNRHLDGMTTPDDRNDPRIEARLTAPDGRPESRLRRSFKFPPGMMNVRVRGVFAYRDHDPQLPMGRVPEGAKTACTVLVNQGVTPLSKPEVVDRMLAPYARPFSLGSA